MSRKIPRLAPFRCALAALLALAFVVSADAPPARPDPGTAAGADAGAMPRRKRGQPFRKATAPIGIEVDVAAAAAPGQPVTVRVTISPAVPVTGARVAFAGTDELALVGTPADVDIGALAAGAAFAVAVEILPIAAGRHHLRVHVTADSPRGPLVRSLVVPIPVGSAAGASMAELGVDVLGGRPGATKGPAAVAAGPQEVPVAGSATAAGRDAAVQQIRALPARETVR